LNAPNTNKSETANDNVEGDGRQKLENSEFKVRKKQQFMVSGNQTTSGDDRWFV